MTASDDEHDETVEVVNPPPASTPDEDIMSLANDTSIVATPCESRAENSPSLHDSGTGTVDERAPCEVANAMLVSIRTTVNSSSVPVVAIRQQDDQGVPLASAAELIEQGQTRRPAFISATVLKATQRTDLGISVEKVDDSLRIADIDSDSLFEVTPLLVGDTILSVNSYCCENKREASVVRQMKRSKRWVTLVIKCQEGDPYLLSTTVTKPSPTSRVGIGFQYIDGYLRVSSIDPSGLFAGGILNVGNKCVSINGVPCTFMDSTAAVELIRKEEQTVTIVTRTEQEAGVVVAAVSSKRYCALWVRYLVSFLLGVIVIVILAYFFSEKHYVAPTGRAPCKTTYGQPLPYSHCQNRTRPHM